jgi:hypothetical protein
MMCADFGVVDTRLPAQRRLKAMGLTCADIASRALRDAGCAQDSLQPQFLTRYAELKRVSVDGLQQWLDRFTPEQMPALRHLLESVVIDCDSDPDALTTQPFIAAERQLKLVQQFGSDGSPLWKHRLPRLNTVDAIDDALSAENLPLLGLEA